MGPLPGTIVERLSSPCHLGHAGLQLLTMEGMATPTGHSIAGQTPRSFFPLASIDAAALWNRSSSRSSMPSGRRSSKKKYNTEPPNENFLYATDKVGLTKTVPLLRAAQTRSAGGWEERSSSAPGRLNQRRTGEGTLPGWSFLQRGSALVYLVYIILDLVGLVKYFFDDCNLL